MERLKITKSADRAICKSLLLASLLLVLASNSLAQTKTTVADTLSSPSGAALSGTITLTNNATFRAADGTVVPKGAVTQVTVTNGAFSVQLVPNEGSTPSGSSYAAVYKLGQAYLSETWVVPSSASPVDLSEVRTASAPTPAGLISDAQLPAVISHSAIRDKGGQVFNVKAYGAVGDGAADDTAAVQAAIDAAVAANGGTIFFPPGSYLIAGALSLPNSGGGNPRQMPLRFTGVGRDSQATGSYAAGAYGSVLNLTYGSGNAKFDTTGIGILELDHLTLEDTGGDSVPFVRTTNTALHVHNCSFLGSKTGTAADQDAIVLGTTGSDWFQGYGTVIRDNFFDYIRRAVYGLNAANSVQIVDNTIWLHSGSNLADGAAIELDGSHSGGNGAAGNYVSGNLIEQNGYVYGIKTISSNQNYLAGNTFWDNGPQTLAAFKVDSASTGNTVICTLTSGNCVYGTGAPGSTFLFSTSGYNTLPNGLGVNEPDGAIGAAMAGKLDVWGADYTAVLHGDSSSTVPTQLDIRGSTDWSQELHIGYNTADNYGSVQAIHTGNSYSPLALNPQGGSVGIGVTSPQHTLDVAGGDIGNSAGPVSLTAGGTNQNITITPSGAGQLILGTGNGSTVDNISNGTFAITNGATTNPTGFPVWMAYQNATISGVPGSLYNVAQQGVASLFAYSTAGDFGAAGLVSASRLASTGSVAAGVNPVTFSATPSFDLSQGDTQKITLTANVTSSTLSNPVTGQTLKFIICQDASGGHTFAWPSNVHGAMTVGSTASKCSAQEFIYDGTDAYALSAGVINQ